MTRFIDACEQESLHLSGHIQAHGTLLMLDKAGIVSHVAENLADFLEFQPIDVLGRPLPHIFGGITENLGAAPGSRRFVAQAMRSRNNLLLDLVITRGEHDAVVIEMTPWQEPALLAPPTTHPTETSGVSETFLAERRHALVQEIYLLTGAHRVMYYVFQPDGDGEVLDEACGKADWGSYLGLRFPGSDIPMIARQLYLKNPWRLIPDATAPTVQILSLQEDQTADLTWSDLRSVSPVHLQYLANMGVRASLSFPVIVNGQLHALVAAHHQEPITLPASLLSDIASRVQEFAQYQANWITSRRIRLIDAINRRFDNAKALWHVNDDLFTVWPEVAPLLMAEFKADGATICIAQNSASKGICFEPETLAEFDEWFTNGQTESVWQTDSLTRSLDNCPLTHVTGVLAIHVAHARDKGIRIYLTRQEQIHEVAWGGNPNKPVEYHDGKLGIAPRRSFEKWVEKRLGYSRPWDNESRLLALKLRDILLHRMMN